MKLHSLRPADLDIFSARGHFLDLATSLVSIRGTYLFLSFPFILPPNPIDSKFYRNMALSNTYERMQIDLRFSFLCGGVIAIRMDFRK